MLNVSLFVLQGCNINGNSVEISYFKNEGVDVIIVYVHWGDEFTLRPNERQVHIAEYLHSLGVAAVIGGHPHTLQGHRKTKHQLTVYSTGNFLFPSLGYCWRVSCLLLNIPAQWAAFHLTSYYIFKIVLCHSCLR